MELIDQAEKWLASQGERTHSRETAINETRFKMAKMGFERSADRRV
jgi:hypothetical protein